MVKRLFAVIALVILAIFSIPAAANAVGYVPDGDITVTGPATPGSTVTVNLANGSFTDGEIVSVSVTGEGTATLSIIKAATATITKAANANGALGVNVKLPTPATGSYTVTATGLTSGNVGTATITVAAADHGPAATGGASFPVLIIWGVGGILLLGIALLVVLRVVRRQRAKV